MSYTYSYFVSHVITQFLGPIEWKGEERAQRQKRNYESLLNSFCICRHVAAIAVRSSIVEAMNYILTFQISYSAYFVLLKPY
jgi:hypothetical protein